METKQKTLLEECRDKIAVKYKFDNWENFSEYCWENRYKNTFGNAIDEAAELYAGQTKKSEPVSLEVEQAAKDYAADYSNPHNHKKDLKFSESDIFYIRQSTFKDAIKWQSQQPLKLSQIAFSEPYQNLQREYAELKQKFEAQQQSVNAELEEKIEDLQIMSEAKDMALAELKQELEDIKDQNHETRIAHGTTIEENIELKKQNAELVEALKEIQQGKGAYSLDRLEHAGNVIKEMIRIATEALSKHTT